MVIRVIGRLPAVTVVLRPWPKGHFAVVEAPPLDQQFAGGFAEDEDIGVFEVIDADSGEFAGTLTQAFLVVGDANQGSCRRCRRWRR